MPLTHCSSGKSTTLAGALLRAGASRTRCQRTTRPRFWCRIKWIGIDLLGVAVKDKRPKRRGRVPDSTALGQSLPILVAPAPNLFRKRRLSNMLRAGKLPVETEFRSGVPNG